MLINQIFFNCLLNEFTYLQANQKALAAFNIGVHEKYRINSI